MKILSYNINSCNQQKLDELFKHKADVYVIPEMSKDVKVPEGYLMKWVGKYPSKGLGVIYNNTCDSDNVIDESLSYAIPLYYKDLFILAFWPTKNDKKESYTQIAKQILNHYSAELQTHNSIVIGDFNLYHKNDKPNKDADILEIDQFLQSCRLKSFYHEITGKAFGEEIEKTYFHQYKADNPFFLDYTYYSYENLKITKYELLDWDTKFSDHRGQIIEF